MEGYGHYKRLRFDQSDGVLTVTLDPGTSVNAITGELHTELSTVFYAIGQDTETRAVVLTGAGRAFCGGADLHWLRDMSPADRDLIFAEARRIVFDLLELPQPIIAAVEGPAVGLGATIALFCDVKIAGESAKFGDPHVSVGLVAGDGGAVIWPCLVGAGRAKRYLMTGDLMTAAEAERIGLIEEVVPKGEALAAAQALATRLADGHTAAIQGTKTSVNKFLRDAANLVLDTSLAIEKETMGSPEHQAAVLAFLEHTQPGR